MKQNPETMSTNSIERELDNFSWEYIAASDKAQTDAEYQRLSDELDKRRAALTLELQGKKDNKVTP
jgi:hypothetical protein